MGFLFLSPLVLSEQSSGMEMNDVSRVINLHVLNDDQCIYNVAMMNVVILGDEINW
jgi:hypothetical protein